MHKKIFKGFRLLWFMSYRTLVSDACALSSSCSAIFYVNAFYFLIDTWVIHLLIIMIYELHCTTIVSDAYASVWLLPCYLTFRPLFVC